MRRISTTRVGPPALPGPDGYTNVTRHERSSLATRVAVLYDEHYLYVRFNCEQRNAPIVATQSTNDVGFGLDDFVGIGIDTSGNGTQVYYFEVTPRGVRYQQASESNHYRPAWSASARIAAGRWDAALRIPLTALKYRSGAAPIRAPGRSSTSTKATMRSTRRIAT